MCNQDDFRNSVLAKTPTPLCSVGVGEARGLYYAITCVIISLQNVDLDLIRRWWKISIEFVMTS